MSDATPLPLALFVALAHIDARAVPVSLLRVREEDTVDRQRARRSRELSLAEVEDAQDLRSVIATTLAATPVDEESLRRGVWTYVGAERDVGARPGSVILTLTEMVEASTVAPRSVRDDLMRRVILWCVETYFSYLGGEGVGRRGVSAHAAPTISPMIVSNR